MNDSTKHVVKTDPEKRTLNVLGYARVSTKEQELDVQKEQIVAYCHKEGYNLIDIVEEKYSGRSKNRPGWDIIMENVRQRKIDGIVFLRADRIARSTKNLLSIVDEFIENKIKLISINDPMFQGDIESPQGKLVVTIMGAMAEFETNIISERMREGKERAERMGTKSGKPMHRPKIEMNWEKYDELLALGVTKRKIAVALKISESKLHISVKERYLPKKVIP